VAAAGDSTLTARGTFGAQSSPTGVFIAGSTTDPAGPVVVLDNATGRRLLTVTVPEGYDTCRLVRWWSSTEVLVTRDAVSLRHADLLRVPAPPTSAEIDSRVRGAVSASLEARSIPAEKRSDASRTESSRSPLTWECNDRQEY